jgi:hypothetical protein
MLLDGVRYSLDRPTARLARLGLVIVCLAAGVGVVLETAAVVPDAASSPEPLRRDVAPPVQAPAKDATASDLAAIILERPLFSPQRRPPMPVLAVVAPAPPPTAASPPEWTWRLAGIMGGPGRREALFIRAGEKRTASEGQEIDGWTLTAVRRDSVTISRADGEKTISPQRDVAGATDARIRADEILRRQAAQRGQAAMAQMTKAMMAAPAPAVDARSRRNGR